MKVFNKVFAIIMVFSVIMLTSAPVHAAESITSATVTGVQYEVTETGSAITFPIVVKVGETQLTENTDYTVTYADNIAVGQASIKITGIGNYEGEQLIVFNIVAKDETTTTPADEPEADEEVEEEEEEEEDEDIDDDEDDDDVEEEKPSKSTGSNNGSNNSSNTNNTTKTNSTKNTADKAKVNNVAKSPKTGDFNNGAVLAIVVFGLLLVAGSSYYVVLRRSR